MDAILFDLDGTLTDPYDGISRCIAFAMERIGRPLAAETDFRQYVGPPLHRSFETLCAAEGGLVHSAVAAFRERYSTLGLYENCLYPGISEMLTAAYEFAPLFVCTSKPTAFAERVLDHFGLRQYFEAIYGSELDGVRSDKGDLMAWLIEREGLAGLRLAMVGDREHDVRAARQNGVIPIGVLWGYGSAGELENAGAVETLRAPSELLGAIRARSCCLGRAST
jgi:phosphoglycolate phosphatase